MSIKVLFADDNKLIRELLINYLVDVKEIEVVAQAENGKEAFELASKLLPDIIVMDIDMPVLDGVKATEKIKKDNPEVGIIALTMHSKAAMVKRMLEAGALGYLSKNCNSKELVQAIKTVHSGKKFLSEEITDVVIRDYLGNEEVEGSPEGELSDRELEILKLIVDGIPVSSIADKLFVSVKTINTHRQNILEKLGLKSTADLVKYAIRKGIVSLDKID
jgi:two-component system, NarL family, response regulator NreC